MAALAPDIAAFVEALACYGETAAAAVAPTTHYSALANVGGWCMPPVLYGYLV